jgi:hypothetical protein
VVPSKIIPVAEESGRLDGELVRQGVAPEVVFRMMDGDVRKVRAQGATAAPEET